MRGQYISLDATWQEACARVDYPPVVSQALGEAFVAAGLLSATIKFEGKLTLQVRGAGNIHLLVVHVTNDGKLRGLARWRAVPTGPSLTELFGADAQLTIAIEATRGAEPYLFFFVASHWKLAYHWDCLTRESATNQLLTALKRTKP